MPNPLLSWLNPGYRKLKQLGRPYGYLLLLSLILVACTHSRPQISSSPSPTSRAALTIWWDKGYVLEEDEAIQRVVTDWSQKSGIQPKLSFYTTDEITQKALRANQAGHPPDVLFSSRAEYPLLAWEGKLADVSEVIQPIASLYEPAALKAVNLYNNQEKRRSYYAVPLHQATIHVFYWKDLLEQAGYRPADIPSDWDGFWNFWKTVQDRLRSKSGAAAEIYGLGLPFSIGASDTHAVFEQILEANDVKLLDAQGQLLVDQPEVRQGIIQSLEWYSQLYQQGYVPPTALKWLDPDNNRSLLNREIVMTLNPTLSIPIALRQDPNFKHLVTLELPKKPSGQPMRYLVSIRQAVVFANSPRQDAAKEFLAYLTQPQVLSTYLKSAGGRYLPVMPQARQDPFWTDPRNPHLAIATKTLEKGLTRPFYIVQNPAYTKVLAENVWGKAIQRIVVDQQSAEQAADEAIAKIKQYFQSWQ